MRQDAFTGGVDPGGLWTQNDVRILICYILSSIGEPMSREDLCAMIQNRALANYFEAEDALAALEVLGHLRQSGGGLTVTDTGREIAKDLDTSLPLAVRDKALEAAMQALALARARREHRVEIIEAEKGWQVRCHISGGGSLDLMEVSLYVPDRAQAALARENFHKNPDAVYKLLLAALTGDRAYAQEYFAQ
ncbi:DUF4364 family protein [Acutalibacter intestini]|uniref:DUF4364 family protein n=1 Tax=Acutalibacter intestini TaxID=3093659 RepID=UPI002AC99993|nr:DUF4364 family protein [Acutalibacter sp. M00204]